jgi:malonyl CoA-acyl carrier protein transacylase
MCMPLPVSAAFHSRYVADAAIEFASFLAPMSFADARLPVIANVTAQPYPSGTEGVKSLLVKQITQSVQWLQSVRYLAARGVREFQELGPGNVLTRLIQQIQPAVAA